MPVTSLIVYTVAAVTALITFLVSLKAFRQFSAFDNPIISICVGLLTFLAMLQLGQKCLSLLIPYQALGLALVVFFLLGLFFRPKSNLRHRKPVSHAGDKRELRNSQTNNFSKQKERHADESSYIRNTGMGL